MNQHKFIYNKMIKKKNFFFLTDKKEILVKLPLLITKENSNSTILDYNKTAHNHNIILHLNYSFYHAKSSQIIKKSKLIYICSSLKKYNIQLKDPKAYKTFHNLKELKSNNTYG